jgi:hypothetical protein
MAIVAEAPLNNEDEIPSEKIISRAIASLQK